jgi:hypothetical protein
MAISCAAELHIVVCGAAVLLASFLPLFEFFVFIDIFYRSEWHKISLDNYAILVLDVCSISATAPAKARPNYAIIRGKIQPPMIAFWASASSFFWCGFCATAKGGENGSNFIADIFCHRRGITAILLLRRRVYFCDDGWVKFPVSLL